MNDKLIKDPDADLDYGVDWTGWLDGDEIVQSTWIAPVGIIADRSSHAGGVTTTWLQGGTVGRSYRVTNRIVTAAGRTDDRDLIVWVQNR